MTPHGLATDSTWQSAPNGAWATGTNWTAGAPGATSGTTSTDTATFTSNGSVSPFITVDSNRNLANITFSTISGVNNYLFTGGGLLPTAGGTIQTASSYTGAAAFSTGLTLQGNYTLNASGAAGSGLNFGTITTAASLTTPTLALTGSNTGVFNTVQGIISQGASTVLSLSKTGAGTWLLAGANTYTGGTTLNGGTLITNNATALGSSGTIRIAGNSTLRTNTALTDASARMTIDNGATLTFDTNNQAQTWAGLLGNSGGSNTAGLTKTGLGSLTLQTGANLQSYRGATTVNMGTLTVNALTSNTATVTNPISSSSALVLGGGNLNLRAGTSSTVSTGSGTSLTLTAANSSVLVGALVTGTNIAAGTTVSSVANAVVTLSQALTGTPSGTVSFGATTLNQTFNGTTLNAGISQFIPASSSGTNVIDFGVLTRNNGSLLNLTTASGYTLNSTGTTNNAGGLVKGVFIGNDFARLNPNFVAAAYTTQNASGSWTSGTTNYITNGAVTGSTASGAAINALKLNAAASQNITITDTLTVNDGILFGSTIAANNSQISGGTLTSGSGDLIIVNNNAQATFGRNTITSTIVNNSGGATNIVLYSAAQNGMLFVGGENTYTGNTYIGGGVNAQTGTSGVTVGGFAGARIGSASATVFLNGGTGGSTNTLRVGNGDATGDVLGTIQIDNGNLTLNRTDTSTLSATVRGTAGGGFVTLGNTGNTTINLGSGSNTFQTLTSTAAGTLNLNGVGSVNTFISSAPFSSGFNTGSTVNFNSGTYIFNGTGNTGNNRTGLWNVQGATVQILGGRYWNSSGGTLAVSSGSVQFAGDRITAGEQQSNGTAINFNVSGTGLLDVAAGSNAAGFTIGNAGAVQQDSTSSVTVNQTGGTVQVGVNAPLANQGGGGTSLSIGNGSSQVQASYNLSGGVLRVAGAIQGMAPTATTGRLATTSGQNTATLTVNDSHYVGEVLSGTNAVTAGVNGLSITAISGQTVTLSGNATATSGAIAVTGNQPSANLNRVLNWTGGTLTAGTINMTNLGGAGIARPYTIGSTGTLFQTGSSSVMSPGDTFGGITYAGRTAVTGNYTIDAGTVAIGLGGTTAATVFHNTSNGTYDNLSVTGATTLGGRLALTLNNGYAPLNASNHNIIVGTTAGATGNFTNQVVAAGGNQRVVLADGLNSFLIATNTTASAATVGGLTSVAARTTAVGGYQASNTYSGAGTAWDTVSAGAWTNFDPGATANPATQASGAIAQFADGTASIGAIGVSLNSMRNIQGIQFSAAADSRAYTISGSGAVILDNTANNLSATIADTSTSGTVNAVNVPITLNSNLTASVTDAANTLTIGGDISGTGKSLTKTGDGTLALTASNSYTGTTSINGGTLIMGDSAADTFGTTSVSVAGTATLGGSGIITPTGANGISVASTGKLAPGVSDGIGALTMDLGSTTGGLAMASGSIFDWQLSGSGGTSDQVNFWNYNSGDVVLNNNAVNLKLTGTEAAGTYIATLFKFYGDGGSNLTASGLTSGLSIGTLTGSFSGTPTFDYGTTGEIRLSYSVVPEPTSALAGLLIAAGLMRRRRSA